jgi:hypothetical protein
MTTQEKEEFTELMWDFFISVNHAGASGEPPANVVEGLFAIAEAIDRLTDTLKSASVRGGAATSDSPVTPFGN